jgi:hypothetical protein
MVSKALHPRRSTKPDTVGLLANGCAGAWEIAIEESTTGDRWFAQIEGPSLFLHFELKSLAIIDQMIHFLGGGSTGAQQAKQTPTQRSELLLGKSKATPIHLLRDDEFSDRFFMLLESRAALTIRFTVAGDDLVLLLDALHQVKDELEQACQR